MRRKDGERREEEKGIPFFLNNSAPYWLLRRIWHKWLISSFSKSLSGERHSVVMVTNIWVGGRCSLSANMLFWFIRMHNLVSTWTWESWLQLQILTSSLTPLRFSFFLRRSGFCHYNETSAVSPPHLRCPELITTISHLLMYCCHFLEYFQWNLCSLC